MKKEAKTHRHHPISFLDGILQVQASCLRLVFSSLVQEIKSSVSLVKFARISGYQQRFYWIIWYLDYLTSFQDPWVRHTRHSPLCDYIRGIQSRRWLIVILWTLQRPGGRTLSPQSSARWRKWRMASSTHIQGRY